MAQTQNLILRIVVQRGEISSGDLVEVVAKFGPSPDAIRAAANRMARSTLLTKIGQGRGKVRYTIGPQGQAVVEQFISKFVRYHMVLEGQLAWDGNWLVVTFSIPEEQRNKRDAFRARLAELGFGMLSSSVWLSPVHQEAEVVTRAEELGLAGQVALLHCQQIQVPGIENTAELVYRVWQLDTLDTHYHDFNRRAEILLAVLEKAQQGEPVDAEALFFESMDLQGELMEIVLAEDPCLPMELLASDWPSQHTHELIHAIGNIAARFEVADDDRYHYLFHAIQGMEVLEAFMPEGDESFHWPEEEQRQ